MAAAGIPLVKLEQNLNGWKDLTTRLLWGETGAPVVITRGVSEDRLPQAGTMTLTLDNSDGVLTPERSASSYYPYVTRFREIRFSEFLNGVWQLRFWGYVDSESLAWGNSVGTDCRVNVTAIDAISMLGRRPLRSVAVETTVERSPIAYYPLTDPESASAADQSGTGQPALKVKQWGTGGEVAWQSGVILPTDSGGGIVFTPASDNGVYLASDVGIDLPTFWCASFIASPAAKDGYLFQIGTDSYSLGVWYDTSAKTMSAIETKLDSSGDPIDYVLSTSGTWSGPKFDTLTVTPTTVKLGSSGTTGTRHSSTTMLDSIVAVGGAFAVESGRARMYSGEIKHLGLWVSLAVTAGLDVDQMTGPAEMFTLSDAIGKLATWSGMPAIGAVTQGSDRTVELLRTEGSTAADLMGQYMQGTLSRISGARDGQIRVTSFDYLPAAVVAPSGVIDPGVEWDRDLEGDVSEASTTWPDGSTYSAKSSADGQAREIPGVVPDSGGRSVVDWTINTSAAPPRVPYAPFDLMTITAANAHQLASLDFGDLLQVPGLPVQLPSTTQSGIIDGSVETIGADVWAVSLPTSYDPRDRMLIVGDATRGKVTAGYLAAPLGPVVDDTNSTWHAGNEITHTHLNSTAWNGPQIQAGASSITPVANTVTSLAVTFPTAFSAAPTVVLTIGAGSDGDEIQEVSVASVSTTGFTIWIYRTTTTVTSVQWLAVN